MHLNLLFFAGIALGAFASGVFDAWLKDRRQSSFRARFAIDLGIALRRRYHLIPRDSADSACEIDGIFEEIKRLI